MTMSQTLPRRRPITSSHRVNAAQGEIYQSCDPASWEAHYEVQIAAPELTSRRWQEPDRKSAVVRLP